MKELAELAANDPGGDEAVAAAVEHLDRADEPDVAAALRTILEAWGRRLYTTSGARSHGRGTESHQARIRESTTWVWERLREWRPNPDGTEGGSPAAYLNSIKHRLPPDLTVATGGGGDRSAKGRRVLAASRVAEERALSEGMHLSSEELRERTRQVLEEHLRALNPGHSEQQIRERMRKDGHNAWLRRLDELQQQTEEMNEETAQDGFYGPRDDRDVLSSEIIEELSESDSSRERRQRLCAPHLQYLVRQWKS